MSHTTKQLLDALTNVWPNANITYYNLDTFYISIFYKETKSNTLCIQFYMKDKQYNCTNYSNTSVPIPHKCTLDTHQKITKTLQLLGWLKEELDNE